MARKINRRTFFKSSVAGGLGLIGAVKGIGLTAPRSAKAEEPVTILNATTFSGAYAEAGMYCSRGVNLAIKRYGGKVLGRPIRLVERDVPNPTEGVRKAQEAVERLGAGFLIVSPSSATVLAVGEYAAKKSVICMGNGGSDKITGSACNKFTFRRQVPTWGAVREVVPRIIEVYQADSFYTITPEYVFGEDLLRNTKEVLEQRGKKFLGNSYHPLGETEYSPHLTKAMAMKADCVLFLNFGGDTVNALKQAANFGLQKVSRVACAWGSGITQMKAIGPKVLEDVIWGLQYFYKIDTPKNKELVEAFREEYGELPPYTSATLYATTMSLLECIDTAGSTEPIKVVEALEGYEYDGLTGRESWRACDHQCLKPYYTIQCKGPQDMKHKEDYGDIIGSSVNYQSCEDKGCKMA
ncbi:MAG: ABC transporter substrate-binding protein [candidate division Zixibacteria bacterium]|nr:ABC transporter substrate-binding protein [candidate division Zixibacteria bacterium]